MIGFTAVGNRELGPVIPRKFRLDEEEPKMYPNLNSLVPRPTLAAAVGLQRRYARNGSGKLPNKMLRDVKIITFQYVIVFRAVYSTMAATGARKCDNAGYETIRPDQNTAIKSFMEGRDVFLSLLTGK